MGPIHSIVPVAVGRKMNIASITNPMFVYKKGNLGRNGNLNLNMNLEFPKNLNFTSSELSIKIPVIDLDEK